MLQEPELADDETGPYIFLSYSHEDGGWASTLQQQLSGRGLSVWLDKEIPGGTRWHEMIDARIREARAVIVLLTNSSAKSSWVTYEYALATGANVPVVAVALPGIAAPAPIQHFQIVTYSTPEEALKQIHNGIEAQERSLKERTISPVMLARFMESGGKLVRYRAKPPALRIELWVEQVPVQTQSVKFEILDLEIQDRRWNVHRGERAGKEMRQFLSNDVLLNRNVEILALGIGVEMGNWSAKSTIHEALKRYYSGDRINADIQGALKQFETS
jgi:hypothetical protein